MIFESLDPVKVKITNGRPHYFKAVGGDLTLEYFNEPDFAGADKGEVQNSPILNGEEAIVTTSSSTGYLLVTPSVIGMQMTECPYFEA